MLYLENDMIETDINCVSISADKRIIAVADNIGPPKLYCYPAHLPE